MVVHLREAERVERLEGRLVNRGGSELWVAGDRDRPIGAVPFAVAELAVRLHAAEGWQHVLEPPAGVAARGPGIEVGSRAADREAREPRRAADEPAATQLARRAARRRLRLEAPVGQGRHAPAVVKIRRGVLAEVRSGLQ